MLTFAAWLNFLLFCDAKIKNVSRQDAKTDWKIAEHGPVAATEEGFTAEFTKDTEATEKKARALSRSSLSSPCSLWSLW